MNVSQHASIETSCKNCVFARWKGRRQTGCEANRLSHFTPIEAYDEEKEFYVIPTICTYYRPPIWNNGVADVEKAEEECTISVSAIISLMSLDEDMYDAIYGNMRYPGYYKDKIQYIFFTDESLKPNDVVEFLKDLPEEYTVVQCFSKNPDYVNKVEIIKHATGTFTVLMNPLDVVWGLNYMNFVNELINNKGKKYIWCEGSEDQDQFILTSALQRFQFGNFDQFLRDLRKDAKEHGYYKQL